METILVDLQSASYLKLKLSIEQISTYSSKALVIYVS